jgi:formate dehydrogenase
MEEKRKKKKGVRPKGRSVDLIALQEIDGLLGDEPLRRDMLIEQLHKIQDHYGHISANHLVALAERMKLAPVELYEVVSFYHHFDLVKEGETAPPPLTIRICESLSCQLAGADELVEKLKEAMDQAKIRIQKVSCVGRCAKAPIAIIGQNSIEQATSAEVIQLATKGEITSIIPDAIGFDEYKKNGGYRLLASCCAGDKSAESVLDSLSESGLRGLGGAGFPVAQKWRIVRDQPAPRLMAVNIDEGEPGTFKDRHYLEQDPHRFLEGMLIAAWAVGIEAIYIYLRDEYAGCRQLLERELSLLKNNPPIDHLPTIHLRRGAGAYICGEESAMVESIEGKRGIPRLRPPFLAQKGLFGRPTLEHNMESLYWVRELLEKGASWFTEQGLNGRKGLRSFSVSGRVKKPGVHLAPAGITVQELIEEQCGGMLEGHAFKAYLPGGASGGILPARMGDIPLDFDTLNEHGCFIGSAAIIILSDQDSVRDAASNLMRFFAHESCGQCTPCRVGTEKAAMLMNEASWDREKLTDLSQVMMDASICGLGQAAPNPLLSVLKYFPEEVS